MSGYLGIAQTYVQTTTTGKADALLEAVRTYTASVGYSLLLTILAS
jgi:hypothetical protein